MIALIFLVFLLHIYNRTRDNLLSLYQYPRPKDQRPLPIASTTTIMRKLLISLGGSILIVCCVAQINWNNVSGQEMSDNSTFSYSQDYEILDEILREDTAFVEQQYTYESDQQQQQQLVTKVSYVSYEGGGGGVEIDSADDNFVLEYRTLLPTYSHGFTVYKAVINKKLYHDPTAFTQGLLYHNGGFYESTGNPPYPDSDSVVRRFTYEWDNYVLKKETEPGTDFGEGIAILNNKLYQLVEGEDLVKIFNLDLEQIGEARTALQTGWGATSDGTCLIISDGSDTLYFYDVDDNFNRIKQLKVTFQGNPFYELNELEWIDGLIYANVLRSDCIVGIEPFTGSIVKILIAYASQFRNKLIQQNKLLNNQETVLNGLAHDAGSNKTYITGKLWPYMYQVDFEYEFDQDNVPEDADPYWKVIELCT
eukprot:TRINITY_DN6785_c0_g1_i4.p2 TRINITY_DN6785_c0_g1~~TRINITY_DN6785_c0_g1_i4.p2  ORF type:complete len:422 (-),score=40.71 TRINITY_DN6785_c0_g1_i4:4719-5984(-)